MLTCLSCWSQLVVYEAEVIAQKSLFQQVSAPDARSEQALASRPSQQRLSLTQLVYALSELQTLDVRKAPGMLTSQPNLWTPACWSSLMEIRRAMHKASPWYNLETFACDANPSMIASCSW